MTSRIIGGQFKGRGLFTPAGGNTRPTSAMVRKSLFDVICHHPDWHQLLAGTILDLCAGAGLVGLEALSRHDEAVLLLVEPHRSAITAIQDNIKKLAVEHRTHLLPIKLSSLWDDDFFLSLAPCDIIFADPPYNQPDLVGEILHHVADNKILKKNGLLILQTPPNFSADNISQHFSVHKEKKVGNAKVWFLQRG